MRTLRGRLARLARRPMSRVFARMSTVSRRCCTATARYRCGTMLLRRRTSEVGTLDGWARIGLFSFHPDSILPRTVDMNSTCEGADRDLYAKDAVFISPHKFAGGPGTPGLLVVKKNLLANAVPTVPGGGTVFYVTHDAHR